MPEGDSLLLHIYGNSPQMKILNFLMEFPKNDFTQKEILEELGMSKTTFYKYFDNLLEYELIKVSRKIAKSKLCMVNLSSPIVRTIKHSIDQASENIANKEVRNEKLVESLRKDSGESMEVMAERLSRLKKELEYTRKAIKEEKARKNKEKLLTA